MKKIEYLTRSQVVGLLHLKFNGCSVRTAAKTIGISHSYFHDVMKGDAAPGPLILQHLNLEKIETKTVVYRQKKRVRK